MMAMSFWACVALIGVVIWIAVLEIYERINRKMSIDPKIALWINIVLAIANAITTGGLSFAGIISPTTAAQIVAIATTIQVVLSSVMHAVSSSQPGPLAAPPVAPSAPAQTPAQK